MNGITNENNTSRSDDQGVRGGGEDIMAGNGPENEEVSSESGRNGGEELSLIETGPGSIQEFSGDKRDRDLRPDTKTGPAGELIRLGMAAGEVPGSIFKRIKRYAKNVATSVFKPGEIFCPQKVVMAGGKLQYTLSEDVRVARAEAYDSGVRSGKRQSDKLERYVEGEKAIEIFERGEKKGFNNGFTEGRNERAENSEEVLGGFDDLEEFYNRKPDEVFARISGQLLKVHDWDDEISLYMRRHGKEKTKEYLLGCVDEMLNPERTMPALPAPKPVDVET